MKISDANLEQSQTCGVQLYERERVPKFAVPDSLPRPKDIDIQIQASHQGLFSSSFFFGTLIPIQRVYDQGKSKVYPMKPIRSLIPPCTSRKGMLLPNRRTASWQLT